MDDLWLVFNGSDHFLKVMALIHQPGQGLLGLTWSKCKTQGTTTVSDLPFLGEKSSSLGARVDRDPYPNRRHLVQSAPRLPMVHHHFPPDHSILFSWGVHPVFRHIQT